MKMQEKIIKYYRRHFLKKSFNNTKLPFLNVVRTTQSLFHFTSPVAVSVLCSNLVDGGVSGSIPGRGHQSSCSEFSVVVSEIRINTGQDPLERPQRRVSPYRPRPHKRTISLNPTIQPTFFLFSKCVKIYRVKVCITGWFI